MKSIFRVGTDGRSYLTDEAIAQRSAAWRKINQQCLEAAATHAAGLPKPRAPMRKEDLKADGGVWFPTDAQVNRVIQLAKLGAPFVPAEENVGMDTMRGSYFIEKFHFVNDKPSVVLCPVVDPLNPSPR